MSEKTIDEPLQPAGLADATVLAHVWEEVLGVDGVGPDDDFFSLGGDSLLAVQVVGAARERGLRLTLLDLFKNPTPRGACAGSPAGAGEEDETAELLSAQDRALVPDSAEAVYPASRLQLGLIYESLLSEGDLYIDVVSRTVVLPLDPAVLRQAVDRVTRRHPMLRTGIDLTTFSEPMQVVERSVVVPVETADWSDLDPAAKAEQYEKVMRDLNAPFDPEQAPLWRVHAAATGTTEFRLAYAFHHAALDGWSESVLADELIRLYAALLRGADLELAEPASAEEYVRLERVALRDDESRRFFGSLAPGAGAAPPERGDGTGDPYRKAVAPIPAEDTRRIQRLGAEWGVPVKSLLLAADCTAQAALSGTSRVTVGLTVSGRTETVGSELTIGLFLNTLPLRLDVADASWRTLAQRAFEAENGLLAHRRFPDAEVRATHGGMPFATVFNYVHFHIRDRLLDSGLITTDEDLRDRSSFPVRVEVIDDPRGRGQVLEVVVDETRYGRGTAEELLQHVLTALHHAAESPEEQALVGLRKRVESR
ncbi:condensation domain-containing protein [Streptomyces sp. NPDC051016]|uniref:condensation domain-containing protein n=1 Tax=Streptomyces sp. NPDC051016 TaxID=3365638 RepID=UPI0037A33A64